MPHLRLLAVDDNPVNRLLIARMLEGMGHTVAVAGGGAEAIAAVQEALCGREAPYDAILMDIQMPEIDGLEAMARIRALGGITESLPIIAVTANAVKGQAEEYLAAGMNGYVSKPVDRDRLAEELARLVPKTHVKDDKPSARAANDEEHAAALEAFMATI